MSTIIKKPIEIGKWDAHSVLSVGDAATDFGSIEAKMTIIAERVNMLKSSLEVNEVLTKWDTERLNDIAEIAREAEKLTHELFHKLNYSVMVKQEI